MKKFLLTAAFLSVIIALSGCKSNNTGNNTNNNATLAPTTAATTAPTTAAVAPTTAANMSPTPAGGTSTGTTAAYKDGTYDVKHKSTKPGYEEAVVTIQGGKIQNIVLKRLDDKGAEVNYDQWNGTGEYPNLKKDRVDLAGAMLAAQSPDVNAISGATASSEGWKAAVSDALNQAKQ